MTQVTNGDRKTFVVELWPADDTPSGFGRPVAEDWLNFVKEHPDLFEEVGENPELALPQ